MKLDKLLCYFLGHKWTEVSRKKVRYFGIDWAEVKSKCSRCGKDSDVTCHASFEGRTVI